MENTKRENFVHYVLSRHCPSFSSLWDMSIVLSTVVTKRDGDRWMEKNMEGPEVYLSLSMGQSIITEHHLRVRPSAR